MIFTQFFFTLAFITIFVSLVLVLLYFLCGGPDQKHFLISIRVSFKLGSLWPKFHEIIFKITAFLLLAAGICGGLGVIIFACFGNRDKWMPGYANNWFGWSFVLAAVGSVAALVCSALFFTEHHAQERRVKQFKESQIRFEMEHETKT